MNRERLPYELEASWKEKDMAGGETVDAQVLIMRTNGCVAGPRPGTADVPCAVTGRRP